MSGLHECIVLERFSSIYEHFVGNMGRDPGTSYWGPGIQKSNVLLVPTEMTEGRRVSMRGVGLGSDPSLSPCPEPFGFAQDRLRRMDQDDKLGERTEMRRWIPADGVIVGSALVRNIVEHHQGSDFLLMLKTRTRNLKAAIS